MVPFFGDDSKIDLQSNEESAEMIKKSYSEYLQESQVFPKLLEILEKLQKMDELPKNPMEFILTELGTPSKAAEKNLLEQELDDAHAEIRRLQLILKKLGIKYEDDVHEFNFSRSADNTLDSTFNTSAI